MFVRWSNLTITADEQARLPGYRDEAVVRRFDAPEALETRFYEVRAKSALNRVPAASQVPFRWTINPYRGCSHACQYCTSGDTPILMADGRTNAMKDLRVGDRIIGTEFDGKYRLTSSQEGAAVALPAVAYAGRPFFVSALGARVLAAFEAAGFANPRRVVTIGMFSEYVARK